MAIKKITPEEAIVRSEERLKISEEIMKKANEEKKLKVAPNISLNFPKKQKLKVK